MTWARPLTVGTPLRKAVLMYLAERADDDGGCWPSIDLIAAETEIGRRTDRVARAMARRYAQRAGLPWPVIETSSAD
ncbi:MAG: helix-turn-helix domain-containing protein [Rhodospirillaceae bacterium]|nr:helix-turn-helix domain-containing protein [Rhodospirillaceae bacterium]